MITQPSQINLVVNGHEIKPDTVWQIANGNFVIITKIEDTYDDGQDVIYGWIHITREGQLNRMIWDADGIVRVHVTDELIPEFDLVKPVTECKFICFGEALESRE